MMQRLRILPSAVTKDSTIAQPLYATRRASNEPIRQRSSPLGPFSIRTVRTDSSPNALSMAMISSGGLTDAQKRVRFGA